MLPQGWGESVIIGGPGAGQKSPPACSNGHWSRWRGSAFGGVKGHAIAGMVDAMKGDIDLAICDPYHAVSASTKHLTMHKANRFAR